MILAEDDILIEDELAEQLEGDELPLIYIPSVQFGEEVFPYAQHAFHTCPADERFYGGAAGGGKSEALLWDRIIKCQRFPGYRAAMFRRTTQELNDLIDRGLHVIPKGIAVYNHNDERFIFKNETPTNQPSIFRFSHMNEEKHKYVHRGEQYTGASFDEASLFTPTQMQYIRATRVRSVLPGVPADFAAGSNPGGPAHLDLKDRYVLPLADDVELLCRWVPDPRGIQYSGWRMYPQGATALPGPFDVWRPPADPEMDALNQARRAKGVALIKPRSRCFIPATLEDNPTLYNDPSYEASLLELARNDPQLFAAMRKGDWTQFQGQMFTEWDPSVHVIPAFDVPKHWPRWCGLDWGWSEALVCLWLTRDPVDQTIYVYRELARERLNDSRACELIRAYSEDGWVDFIAADPSMWIGGSDDLATTKAEVYRQRQVELIQGNNSRLQGVSRVHDMLSRRYAGGPPKMKIMNTCPYLIRTLPALPRDIDKPEDVDTKAEDHAYDALRYALMARYTLETSSRGGARARSLHHHHGGISTQRH